MSNASKKDKQEKVLAPISERNDSQNDMYESNKSVSINSSFKGNEQPPITVEVYRSSKPSHDSERRVRYVQNPNDTQDVSLNMDMTLMSLNKTNMLGTLTRGPGRLKSDAKQDPYRTEALTTEEEEEE